MVVLTRLLSASGRRKRLTLTLLLVLSVVAAVASVPSRHAAASSGTSTPTSRRLSANLLRITNDIATDLARLHALGVFPVQWGPSLNGQDVAVVLRRYSASAAAIVDATLGRDVRVIKTVGTEQWIPSSAPAASPDTPAASPDTVASRNADTYPYYGADPIWQSGQVIPGSADGFNYYGNNTDKDFMLTAGHCVGSSGEVYTNLSNHMGIGGVATNYYTPSGSHNDFASILNGDDEYDGFADGIIWNGGPDSTTYDTVIGPVSPQTGDVTHDGATTGEVSGVTITGYNQDIPYPNGDIITHVTTDQKPGYTVCQPGDSGSPVFQRTSTEGLVNIAGLQVAEGLINNVPDPSYCAYQQQAYILTVVNGTLGTDSASSTGTTTTTTSTSTTTTTSTSTSTTSTTTPAGGGP